MEVITKPVSFYLRQDGYFDDHMLVSDICLDKANTDLTARERYELYLKKRHECGEPIGLLSDKGNVGDTDMVFSLGTVVTPWPSEDDDIRVAKLILGKRRPRITIIGDNCFRIRITDATGRYILPSPLPDMSPFIKEETTLYEYEYKEMLLEGPLKEINNLYEFLHGIETLERGIHYGGKKKKINRIRFLNQIELQGRGLRKIRFFVWLQDQ